MLEDPLTTQAYGTPEWMDVYYATLREGLNAARLEISPEKSKLFDFRQGDALADEGMNGKVNELQRKLDMLKIDQIIALGVPHGNEEFVQQQLAERAETIGRLWEKRSLSLLAGDQALPLHQSIG